MTRLEEIEARLAAATPRPWEASYYDDTVSGIENMNTSVETATSGLVFRKVSSPSSGIGADPHQEIASARQIIRGYDGDSGDVIHPEYVGLRPFDAEFIAHAPTDIHLLIEEVKRLTSENAAMKSMLQSRGFTVVNGQWVRTEETV